MENYNPRKGGKTYIDVFVKCMLEFEEPVFKAQIIDKMVMNLPGRDSKIKREKIRKNINIIVSKQGNARSLINNPVYSEMYEIERIGKGHFCKFKLNKK